MKIRAGYDIAFDCPQPTPMILLLSVHPSRQIDLVTSEQMTFDPPLQPREYRDQFENVCTRIMAPAGRVRFSADFLIADSGAPDAVAPDAAQIPVQDLPDDALIYLLGSRYCDTEHLAEQAWALFSGSPPGWARVQAICDYVHDRLTFGYSHARATRTAAEGHAEKRGVCRDFAHLAITFCRCMNIPARYCTGYLGDIGVPKDPQPMDFSAWFEAYLGGRWYTFDARHNTPRIGRILMARGRDATDVAISTSFGRADLANFTVITDEVE
ncbi:transglutaminase-like domain-containing protein [Rhodoplanes roseus]|uniref:Transglutaminase n=1 Tax=Rhodoplanes roseus TaxID=29409 RepID=A0A327KYW6_9BRAD|nr:transglutaminase family protein [Rhodoplanes roseus]RAI43244.1 transglutaminase [Rhodoplanes roseus]